MVIIKVVKRVNSNVAASNNVTFIPKNDDRADVAFP